MKAILSNKEILKRIGGIILFWSPPLLASTLRSITPWSELVVILLAFSPWVIAAIWILKNTSRFSNEGDAENQQII